MGMLDRYKKSGGFIQLLMVLEGCGNAKREKLFEAIREESKIWEENLRLHLLTFDRVRTWPTDAIAEIINRMQPLSLAAVLKSLPEDKWPPLTSTLSQLQMRKIRDIMSEKEFTAGECATGIDKLLAETRSLISQGVLKIDKFDQQMIIPENIEEHLEHGVPRPTSSSGSSIAAPANSTSQNDESETKGKIKLLEAEVQKLKNENHILKDKLERIKKIA